MSAVLPHGAAVLTHDDLLTVFSALADAAAYRADLGFYDNAAVYRSLAYRLGDDR